MEIIEKDECHVYIVLEEIKQYYQAKYEHADNA